MAILTLYWYLDKLRHGTTYNVSATEAERLVKGEDVIWKGCKPVIHESGTRRIVRPDELTWMATQEKRAAIANKR